MLGIIRLIILLALGWLAYRYIRRFLALDKPADGSSEQSNSGSDRQQQSLPMQRCAQCQIHLPEGESTRSSGHYFCCEAHRDAWLENNAKDH